MSADQVGTHSKHQTADSNLVLDYFETTSAWHVTRWVASDPTRPRVGRWEKLFQSSSYNEARAAFDRARRAEPVYVETREEALEAYRRDGAHSNVVWKPKGDA